MSTIKTDRSADTEQAIAATAVVGQVESEIRAFVRRDVSAFRRQPAERGGDVGNVGSVIDGMAKASISEIDRVMAELAKVRDLLRSEGERVQREISGYGSLSHTAMTSMKIIGDSLVQWKSQTPQVAQVEGLASHNPATPQA